MLTKILVANRGEIACRIIKTARAFGIRTVAVYSDADAHALHVQMADQAVPIGKAPPGDSYLRGEAIIQAALDTGAQAIHPGYGFLSENPEFVDAVVAAGLTFVGPSADAIRAMGLKDAAKALMEQAGVPVVPGYHGTNQAPEHLAGQAAQIGYPVLIKAVAGGGGKGMRLVETADAFPAALDAARNEARGAFGNPDVLVEKYVSKPRHIEVQILGDGTRAVHLFERDCSLQRRHQKVIEEAPAPGMTPQMRAAMGAAAVRAAEAIGYCGAGTVEFIVDASDGLHPDRLWFMEMNTCLQVEHPVTEAITGLDLVEWQFRVAAGEPLPWAQADLVPNGHAFEARLYAEDVPGGFLPATGRLAHLRFAPGARADTGVRSGDEISPHYDPMIAKIIVHGSTRAVALRKLQRALAETEVAGTVTNHAFLRKLAQDPDFVAGDVDTGLIAAKTRQLCAPLQPCNRSRSLAAIAMADLAAPGPLAGFTLWAPMAQDVTLGRDGQIETARITIEQGGYHVALQDARHRITRQEDTWWVDGEKTGARLQNLPSGVVVFWGNAYEFDHVDPLARDTQDGSDASAILAPMPGLVQAVLVAPGQSVAKGDRLAVLEAMKMEHGLTAPRDATIAEVLVAAGDQVQAGVALISLAEEESS